MTQWQQALTAKLAHDHFPKMHLQHRACMKFSSEKAVILELVLWIKYLQTCRIFSNLYFFLVKSLIILLCHASIIIIIIINYQNLVKSGKLFFGGSFHNSDVSRYCAIFKDTFPGYYNLSLIFIDMNLNSKDIPITNNTVLIKLTAERVTGRKNVRARNRAKKSEFFANSYQLFFLPYLLSNVDTETLS